MVALERALADGVLSRKPKNGDLELIGDLRSVLRRYPKVDLRFIFPIPIVLPASRFRVGTALSSKALAKVDRAVFYLELSDVGMVGPPSAPGLVLEGGAGPAGPAPGRGILELGNLGAVLHASPRRRALVGAPDRADCHQLNARSARTW